MTRASVPRRQPSTPSVPELLTLWGQKLFPRVSLQHPAVSETARELARVLIEDPDEVTGAVERFSRRMGTHGWSLADVANWVARLAEAAGPTGARLQTYDVGIAVGQGWSATVLHGVADDAITDALTGLSTVPVLGLRLRQVQDQCRALGLDPRDVYTLVVVDVDVAGRPPLFRDATRVVVADRVAASFCTGETVCATGGPIVVLASRVPALVDQVAELENNLRTLTLLDDTSVLVWLEDLPADPGLIDQFLDDLAGR
jgi:hypothetical protein